MPFLVLSFISVFFLCLNATPVLAQDSSLQQGDNTPDVLVMNGEDAEKKGFSSVISPEPTHPVLKLTPDRSELIRFNHPIGTVIVGNDAHANVLVDSVDAIVIVPRLPGATHFVVMDRDGQLMMQRHIVVAAPQQDYVRIRRSCANVTEGCAPTSMYYCPDACHPIAMSGDASQGGGSAGAGGGNGSAGSTSGSPADSAAAAAQSATGIGNPASNAGGGSPIPPELMP